MKKTAIYVKASSELQLESRKKSMINYCTEQGFDVAKIYVESYSKRESFDKLIKDARTNEFDAVLFQDMLSLGRKIKDFFTVCIELNNSGIVIIDTQDGVQDELLIKAMVSKCQEIAEESSK